jgi:cytosine permease
LLPVIQQALLQPIYLILIRGEEGGRAWLTVGGSLVGIVLALAGILTYFMDFLILLGVVYPAIAGVMFTDFFLIRKKEWVDKQGWNWMATLALVVGGLVGYITQYHYPMGIPAIQSIIVASIVYFYAMKLKAKVSPDQFTDFEIPSKVETGKAIIR